MLKNKIYICILALGLLGCEPTAKNFNEEYSVRPKHLQHCSIDRISDSTGTSLVVVYCPNATTTVRQPTKQGNSVTTISDPYSEYNSFDSSDEIVIIDGKEYVRRK